MSSDRFVDLLRHGSVAGGERFRGATDDPLDPAGLAKMRAVARGQRGWDALFSSPACRCAGFARELAGQRGLPLELLPELAERRLGAWENRTASEIPSAELERFWRDPVGFTPPGAEPFQDFCARTLQGWNSVLGHGCRFPLLVTHGGIVRVVLGHALDMPANALLRIEVPPACRTRLRVPDGEGCPSLLFHGQADPCGARF